MGTETETPAIVLIAGELVMLCTPPTRFLRKHPRDGTLRHAEEAFKVLC
jgi:hypothetical protein